MYVCGCVCMCDAAVHLAGRQSKGGKPGRIIQDSLQKINFFIPETYIQGIRWGKKMRC